MKNIVIDGLQMKDREAVHRTFKECFSFPETYGNNLDALYDCLTDLHEETELQILDWSRLRDALGGYGDKLQQVLLDAEQDNDFFFVLFS